MLIIRYAVVMASPIDLDDEVQFATQEIGEVRTYRHLAAEFVAEFASAELLPQKAFGSRGGVSELFGARGVAWFERLRWPTP